MAQFTREDVEELVAEGFSVETSMDALKQTSGNLELARQYLSSQPHIHSPFDGVRTSVTDASSTFSDQSSVHPLIRSRVDTVASDGSSWLSMDQESLQHRQQQTGLREVMGPFADTSSTSSSSVSSEAASSYARSNAFKDASRLKRQTDDPVVIVPTSEDKPEEYLAALFTILGNIPAVSNALLKHNFGQYGFKPNWWTEEYTPETKELFAVQVQKALASIVHGDRAFFSVNILTQSLPPDVACLLEDETLDEFLPAIYLTLKSQFAEFCNNNDTDKIFEPTLLLLQDENGDSEVAGTERAGVFPIETDSFRGSLYRIFHSLLWGDDFERLGTSGISQVGDIVTVVLLGDGRPNYSRRGVEIPDTFYPQIYTEQYQHLIQDAIDSHDTLKIQEHGLANTTADLTSFKGARVETFLQTAVKHLRGQTEDKNGEEDTARTPVEQALDNMTSIVKQIMTKKSDILDQRTSIRETLDTLDVYDVNRMMESLPEKPTPFKLVGTVFKQTEYAFLKRSQGNEEWCNVNVSFEYGVDPEITPTKFEHVQDSVKQDTRQGFDHPIVLVYVKSTALEVATDELHSGLQDFMNADEFELQRSLENYQNPISLSDKEETEAPDVAAEATEEPES